MQIPTSAIAINPISNIPLNIGVYWVYEVNIHNDQDTATYCCITQTVISNQTQDGYYSAKVEIDRALNLEKGATQLSDLPDMSWAAPAKWSSWYIIKDNRVYLQSGDAPDLSAVEEVSTLEYVFPLSRELPCWHPDPYDRNGAGVGHCVSVAEGPTEKLTPAGRFTDCYLLIGKGAGEWFCNGIGGVESELAGATESFSGVITLVRYYMAQP